MALICIYDPYFEATCRNGEVEPCGADLSLTVEVSRDDEVVVLEEAPPLQVLVKDERAPAKVWTTVALTVRIEHRP